LSFSCLCSERYTGANCEIDLNACASQPCPNGIKCHNLYNDYHCSCPHGFTGKSCQLRGDFDPCLTSPCGSYGTCIQNKSSFTCKCFSGFDEVFCSERVPRMAGDSWSLESPELYILFAIFLLAFLCALLAIIVCRRKNRAAVAGKSQQNSLRADSNSDRLPSSDDPTNALIPATPRIAPPIYQNTVERPPPPIPPKNLTRVPRSNNQTLLSSGLPTVEVRPMQSNRISARDHVCCPTPPQSGSFSSGKLIAMKSNTNHYDETYEEAPKPTPPPHRFVMESEETALLAKGVIVKMPVKKVSFTMYL
jgi:hypothetical protein